MTTGRDGSVVGSQSFEGRIPEGNPDHNLGGHMVRGNFSVARDVQHRMVLVDVRLHIPEEYIVDNPGVDNHFGALANVLGCSALDAAEKVHLIAEFLGAVVTNTPRPAAVPPAQVRRALDLGGAGSGRT